MFDAITNLLGDAGYGLRIRERSYRPQCRDTTIEVKLLKPQNIPRLVEIGAHDAGFTGHDWILESASDVVEVLDTGFDPVRIVAAAPASVEPDSLRRRRVIVASEYERSARSWLDARGYDYVFIRTYGATEVFPPEDADIIIDNAATGRTLEENGLRILDELYISSTRLIANRSSLGDPRKRAKIDEFVTAIRSVLDARGMVMLEMNVAEADLERLISVLPAMKKPTVARLYGDVGYAVKTALARELVPALIPRMKAMGASDIVAYELRRVIP
jgi:ATP phosphoribosyltransferase